MKSKTRPVPEKVQIAMYVSPALRDRLRVAAQKEARTISSWLHFHVLRKLEPNATKDAA